MGGKLDLGKIARLKARLEYYKGHPEARPDVEDVCDEFIKILEPFAQHLKAEGVKEGNDLLDGIGGLKKLLTVRDAAKLLQLDPETVRRLIRQKRLKASKLGGGALRISAPDLAEFYRRQGGGSLFAESS
jgi:excisionase family DNA binding protein